jgi:mannose-6-phosphate isomerase-like protein (cupin superfamily)
MKSNNNPHSIRHISKIKQHRFFKNNLALKSLAQPSLLGGIDIVHEHLEPQTRLPNIYHKKSSEWVFCLKGKMTGIVNGRRHQLREGSILFLPPNTRHSFSTANKACEALSIFAPSFGFKRLAADVHIENIARPQDKVKKVTRRRRERRK